MLYRRTSIFVAAISSGLLAPPWLAAQGYSPDEAPRRMTLPAGLEAVLVASEPLVRQPVAIEFDDAGRLWVIQYLQYPNPAELRRAAVDRYSRTRYDRVPDPPPRGPRGADRITILEDTDGDGRADRGKDFVGGLNLATGLAFGHGGVFVLQVPYLLFYPDRNLDDVPDGDPDVLLRGFGMEDAHSVANSLTWGPDGWLYGCQGSTVTSNIRGIEFQQGVWRYHPITHRFELFCEGGGNSWGLDFDSHGNLFYSTNFGGYAMLHGLQGAYYWKQFGKHGALHNPYAFGYFDHVPHENLTGGHVTVGGIIYQGVSLPTEYRDKYIAADLLGHAVHWHELRERGSTFSARQKGDLLAANDTWFAPSDVTVGPDGWLYVCDWHDQRTAHPDPDADWDRTNGRIYRIQSKQAPSRMTEHVTSLSSARLVDLLGSKNDWYVRRATRLLADRRDPEMIFPLRRLVSESQDDHLALESLWALHVSGGFNDDVALSLLERSSPDLRWWAVRLLGDEGDVAPRIGARLARLAADDPSVVVRCQLAATSKRLPAAQALPIIDRLLARAEDGQDPCLPLLVWWAVEAHASSAREELLVLVTRPDVWKRPLVQSVILERLMRRFAGEATTEGYLACARLLAAAPQIDRGKMFAALDQGLKDRSVARGGSAGTLFANLAVVQVPSAETPLASNPIHEIPRSLADEIDRSWRDDTNDLTLVRLGARLERPAALARALAMATDSQVPLSARVEAVGVLAESRAADSLPALLRLVSSAEPQPLKLAAVDALAAFDDERIADRLFQEYAVFDPAIRSRACDALLSRKPWALRLLDAVDRGRIGVKEISVEQLRRVALHQDAALDALVKKHWGAIQGGTPEERLAEMRRINNDLRAGQGHPPAGKELFMKHCGTCHRLFGEGNQIGPELTHANRKNLDELLATIVSPSAVIRKEYMSFLVQTLDGRVLSGLLVDQTPSSVTLLDAKNERTTIARDRIESINEAALSLMPENLLSPLKPQELRDLFSYLQGEPSASAAR